MEGPAPNMTGQMLSLLQATSGEGGSGGGGGGGDGMMGIEAFMLKGPMAAGLESVDELMSLGTMKIMGFGLTTFDMQKGLLGQLNLLDGQVFAGMFVPPLTQMALPKAGLGSMMKPSGGGH